MKDRSFFDESGPSFRVRVECEDKVLWVRRPIFERLQRCYGEAVLPVNVYRGFESWPPSLDPWLENLDDSLLQKLVQAELGVKFEPSHIGAFLSGFSDLRVLEPIAKELLSKQPSTFTTYIVTLLQELPENSRLLKWLMNEDTLRRTANSTDEVNTAFQQYEAKRQAKLESMDPTELVVF